MENRNIDHTENNVLLEDKIINLLEEIKQEMVSIREDTYGLYIREMRCDITEEEANIWGEKLAYQSKYAELLVKKLVTELDKRKKVDC